MRELDHKEHWVPKNGCFQIVVLEKTLESPLDCKEIKPVNPKGNQPCIFIGRTDAEAEALTHWERPWCWKDWGQEMGMTEDEIAGWYHWLNGHESEQTLGDSEGQEAWCAALHEVTKSRTQLSDWTTMATTYDWVDSLHRKIAWGCERGDGLGANTSVVSHKLCW